MKIRDGFVSNSSGTSFIITNKSDEVKTLEDLVLEIGERMLDLYNSDYDENYKFSDMIEEAKGYDITFPPGDNHIIFGDNYGDVEGGIIGNIFDYELRYNAESDNFSCKFDHYER